MDKRNWNPVRSKVKGTDKWGVSTEACLDEIVVVKRRMSDAQSRILCHSCTKGQSKASRSSWVHVTRIRRRCRCALIDPSWEKVAWFVLLGHQHLHETLSNVKAHGSFNKRFNEQHVDPHVCQIKGQRGYQRARHNCSSICCHHWGFP